jgi:hypothetical protein
MSGNEELGSFNEAIRSREALHAENRQAARRTNFLAGIFQNTKQRLLLRAFLENADQEPIWADLTTFFGPRSKAYLSFYEKMRNGNGRIIGWSWPVFFGSFVWFFYRKMYIWGAASVLIPIVLVVLFPSLPGGAYMSFAVLAKDAYVQRALKRIRKADELGLMSTERTDYLQRAGGVSIVAGAIALFMAAAFLALAAYGIYLERHPTT